MAFKRTLFTVGALGAGLAAAVRWPFAHRFSGGPLVSLQTNGPLFCDLLKKKSLFIITIHYTPSIFTNPYSFYRCYQCVT